MKRTRVGQLTVTMSRKCGAYKTHPKTGLTAMGIRVLSSVALTLLMTGVVMAEDKQQTKPVRLLMVSQSAGFRHGSVTRKDNQLSPAERVVKEMGVTSGLFRADCTQDCAKDFTK